MSEPTRQVCAKVAGAALAFAALWLAAVAWATPEPRPRR